MDSMVPAPILAWFASIDPQVWVWFRFGTMIWLSVGVLVALVSIGYLREKGYSWYISIRDSILHGLAWPLYVLFGGLFLLAKAY